MAQTKKANLFIPQVVGDLIETNYLHYVTVSNFFDRDNTLEGNPGDTLTRNQYTYVGNADVLAEGVDATPVTLTSTPITCQVVKVVKQVELTDEAINSAANDPWGQAVEQISMSIALKDDADAVAALLTATQTATGATAAAAIVAGLKVLGERAMKMNRYCFANTSDYYDMLADHDNWIPASEISADLVQKGVVGMYFGLNVIPSDTVTAKAPIIMLEGAGEIESKAQFLAEDDRNLTNYTHLIAGSEHRVCYLKDATKVVKLTISA